MELKKLVERLEQLTGERVPENTIKKWAHTEKIIPTPIGGGKGGRVSGGKARKADWPAEALEQAAAVWWVREKYRRMYGEKKKKLSKDQINVIKRAASALDESPFAIYTLTSITGPLSRQKIPSEQIKMKFVSEDFDGLDLFLGADDNTKKVECLNELIIAWIATIEKVRAWEAEGMSARIIVENYPDLRKFTPAEIEYSQLDPWLVEVPCPWRIDKPALVKLYWWSRPSKDKRESGEFWKLPFPFQRMLNESKCDDIVLFENGIDTREFFKIDIGDREGWVKAELEKVECEIEENERKQRSLGMEDTDFSTLREMERSFETLTATEKLRFKTVQERLGLAWRQAGLRVRFQHWLALSRS